jgi:peptide/nickel transport system substrate-binding protein
MGIIARASLTILLAWNSLYAQQSNELRFCLRADPKTFDPLLASEEASETIRYLTGGVLIRFNRQTQQFQPELAESWKVLEGGKRIDFVLRKGVRFSDGSPFGAADVIATVSRLMDPAMRSGLADSFRSGTREVKAQPGGGGTVSLIFSAPLTGAELLFDQLAISPAAAAQGARAVLGPFMQAEYKSGQYVLLRRNPHYWKRDKEGKKLPYIDSVRLDIQSNRETELLRFRRGELHFADKLEPEIFDRLRKEMPSAAFDAGASLDSEFFWFNQGLSAPIAEYKRRWFQSKLFRRALSAAIQRHDIVRLVYRGYARPAAGPVSETNKLWFNPKLSAHSYDPKEAMRLLVQDQFRLDGQTLRDRDGNAVEFSLITNAGSKIRTQMAAMVQQDLKKIGIQLNVAPMEFQSLIERIARTQQYEACLLGLTNIEVDPNGQANVWLSSSTHHPWNPAQKTPATSWEAEIDDLIRTQATSADRQARKKAFDRVQEIVSDHAPVVYLVNPHVLMGASPAVHNAAPSALPPHLYWNVEHLSLAAPNAPRER